MSNVSSTKGASSDATLSSDVIEKPTPDATEMAESFEAMLDDKRDQLSHLDRSTSVREMVQISDPALRRLPEPARHLSAKQRVSIERHIADADDKVMKKQSNVEFKATTKYNEKEDKMYELTGTPPSAHMD